MISFPAVKMLHFYQNRLNYGWLGVSQQPAVSDIVTAWKTTDTESKFRFTQKIVIKRCYYTNSSYKGEKKEKEKNT